MPLKGLESDSSVQNAGDLELRKIGSAKYSSIMDFLSVFFSTGIIEGGSLGNNSDGTISISSGEGFIRSTDSEVGDLFSCKWSTIPSVSLTDNSKNYVYKKYVDTVSDPVAFVSATELTDINTHILLGNVDRIGNEIHITSASRINVANVITKIISRFKSTEFFDHGNGAAITETGTRNLSITVGEFWEGINKIITIMQDTSGVSPDNNHTFEYFYRDGAGGWTTHEETIDAVTFTGSGLDDAASGGTFVGSHTIRIHAEITATGSPDTFKWSYKGNDGITVIEVTGVSIIGGVMTLVDDVTITFAATTGHTVGDAWDFDAYLSSQINNIQYDDNSGTLATLGNSKYGVHWVFLDVHGHIAVLFGQGSYSLTDAENALAPSSTPREFTEHSRLVGRIIIAKNGTTFTLIENNYGDDFQGSVPTDHADLTGLATGDDHPQYLLTDGTRAVSNNLVDAKGNVTGATTLDYSAGEIKTMTLTGSITVTISNSPANSGEMFLQITQGGAGSFLITFPSSVKWVGGTAPTLSTTSGDIDFITLRTFDGGTSWLGFTNGLDYS